MYRLDVSKAALLSSLLIAWAVTGCQTVRPDAHSFAAIDAQRTKHVELDLTVDFDAKSISGTASLIWDRPVQHVVLDTADLVVEDVMGGSDASPIEARWNLGRSDPILGAPLTIELAEPSLRITVKYRTKPEAGALQWLKPEQTADKRGPFLFTQSQPILARSWFPCQDSPDVRVTYEARVRVPPGMVALMSAENPKPNATGVYQFRMPQAIPSYLFALAVGHLERADISGRCAVYAEPSVVQRARTEFAETEKMIQAAEKLYGPYQWGRYDLLVLPPSFPWGGMENPRLTFCTPTILAGDRSLTSLIAHELAHSWSGNLVTNANWNDFWLNEGFTVYFEHRIMEALYGRKYDEMLASLSFDELLTELKELPSRDTALQLELTGRDPNDGMTSIPYEKGYFFLRTCEKLMGRPSWDAFLRRYFKNFAFLSMTSSEFVELLKLSTSGDDALWASLRAEDWIYGTGLPSNVDVPESQAFDRVEDQVRAFAEGARAKELETRAWSTHEWLHFLRELPPLEGEQLSDLDETFYFTGTGNAEIASQWLRLAIAHDYRAAEGRLVEFLTTVGRLKLIRPLYQDLTQGSERQRRLALDTYRSANAGYHPIAQKKLDSILR